MLTLFKRIEHIWENYGFEGLVALAFIFIILYSIYNWIKGKKGSWSNKQYFDYNIGTPKQKNSHFNLNSNSSPFIPNSNSNSFGDSKGEIECRRVLENIFKRSFNKARPDFLRNEVTGNNFNLELDCFNQELKLAVEYNGIQHYKFTPYFHKSNEHFLNQKYRDYMKRNLCKDAGITLIEVPYTIRVHKIYDFIKLELLKNGYSV
jgi:hypothetical protein